ncbi:transcriptional regulator [candidate division GN15 bacterium]|uniref:Transcriptional regulator n=1 Tax=candidate division GN15 bacterium TaxID=2072418 RepID=A0A855WWG2_9BACT|nr:MAG: transcriptional regulator [candidate division GN15 bacterium]
MRISAIEEYGLRCLLALAKQGKNNQLSISDIAEMEGLSVPYASKLLAILRRAGLVTAERGRGGGFSIATDPTQINLYDVLTALGGPMIDPKHCSRYAGQKNQCVHTEKCSIHDILGGLAGYVQSFLSKTTLRDLIAADSTGLLVRTGTHIEIAPTALEQELGSQRERTVLE